MTKKKSQYVHLLCRLVGQNVARVIDARDGWPGVIELQLSQGPRRFSLHVGHIHSMSRKDYEYRFQNPGQDRPVMALPQTEPLLIGIWESDAPYVLVAAEPASRLGDLTRFSVLFPERLFREAQQFGWASPYKNNSGGLHWSFFPQLLPTFIDFYNSEVSLSAEDIQIAIVGAGLVDGPEEASAGRARRAATRLIRDAKFGKNVVDAYGKQCAMCGLNLGLVSGAHILPVSAPGSSNDPTNGVALCENHHRAFDNHRIWVHPADRNIVIHPAILQHAEGDDRSRSFVSGTFPRLSDPLDAALRPPPEIFNERYSYFDGNYAWIGR